MKQFEASPRQKPNGARLKPALPRALSASVTRKRGKVVVIFQGGSPAERMRAANQLAEQLALKVYRVDLRPCISRFIGETERNLDRVFETVQPTHTLLYFDEADSLFGKAAALAESFDRSAQWWVPYLNKRIREFGGAVLFATNHQFRTSRISRQLRPLVARIH
jgi:hypothetical protein